MDDNDKKLALVAMVLGFLLLVGAGLALAFVPDKQDDCGRRCGGAGYTYGAYGRDIVCHCGGEPR